MWGSAITGSGKVGICLELSLQSTARIRVFGIER